MRSKRRPGCLVALAVLVAGLAALVGLRQQAGRLAIKAGVGVLGRSLHGRVSYRRLTGDLFGSPRFHDLTIALNGDSVRVRELAFRYDFLGLLRGRFGLADVDAVSPEFFVSPKPQEPARPASQEPDQGTAGKRAYPRLFVRRLHLTRGAVFVGGVPRADSIELTLELNSSPTEVVTRITDAGMTLLLPARSKPGVGESLRLRIEGAEARLAADSLFVRQVRLKTARSHFSGDLALRLDGRAVIGRIENVHVDLSEFLDQKGTLQAKGEARIEDGRKQGSVDYRAEGFALGQYELPKLSGRLELRDSILRLTASGGDAGVGTLEFEGSVNIDRLTYAGRARLAGFRPERFLPALRGTSLNADLFVAGVEDDTVWVSATGDLPGLGVDSFVVRAAYRAAGIELEELSLSGSQGWLWLAGQFRDSLLAFDCVMDGFDLAALSRVAGTETDGRVDGLMSVSGRLDSLHMSGGLRIHGLRVGETQVARALVELDLDLGQRLMGRLVAGGEEIRVGGYALEAAQVVLQEGQFDLRIDRAEDRLLALGSAGVSRSGIDCEVGLFQFATRTDTLSTSEPFRVTWSHDSLAVRGIRYSVADGRVEFECRRNRNAPLWVSAQGKGLNLRKLQKLFRIPVEMWGTADFRLSGQDTLALELRGTGLGLPAVGMAVKELDARLTMTRSWAEIDRLWFIHAADTTALKGRADYNLEPEFKIEDLEVEADIADPGVWVLFFLRPTLELKDGRLYGRLRVSGGLDDPDLSGRVRIVRGELSVPAINTTLERVNAELTTRRNRVVLEKLSGGAGKGVVTADGFVDLGRGWQVDSLRYRIRANDASVNPMAEVYAILDGSVSLDWAPGRPFAIEGNVEVNEALLAFGFGQSAAEGGEPGSDSVVYDIRVRGDRGIWLRNPTADIELSVDLTLKRTLTEETYTGRLSSRQGNLYYLDNTLKVTRGVILFDNITRLNPGLDIAAELPVRRAEKGEEELPERIVLTLGGTLEKPEFRFSSEPIAWDENQIITYLSLSFTAQDLSMMESRDLVTKYLSERLLGYFQTQVTKRVRKFIGLDALRVESELAGGQGYKVTVGKYVGRNLYVTYTQSFTGEMQPAFTVEYYVNRSNELVGARSEDGRYSVRYQFKLRY